MPCRAKGSFECSECGRKIPYYTTDRMNAIRRHYKKHHSKAFKKMQKKAAKTRKKGK